jgi:hypothetical protein
MADPQPIQVTNNTSGIIELFDAYQQTTGDAGPTATTPVTYTSLGTVKAGATGTINTLHASNHIVAMQSGPLADPVGGTQAHFPVKVIAVLSITKKRSFTVEKADKDAMEQNFRFIRYVSANPGSALATQFLAALNDDNQTTAVNAFFAGSTTFGSCTMVTWAAVTAWQSDFLSAWQGSYYLYDATPDLKVMRLVAGASVTLSGDDVQAQLWLVNANGKWTMDSPHTALAITAGQVTEPTPTEGMSVTLQPVWMNAVQSSTTNDTSANSVIAPAMAGTVNGTKVMGNFKQMATPAADSSASSDSIVAWLKQNINIGVLVSAGMLYIMYKQWQESKNTKADEVARQDQAKGADDETLQNDVNDSIDKVDVQAKKALEPVQKARRASFEEFPKNEAAARTAQDKADVQVDVAQQEDALDTVLEEAPASPLTDKVANSLDSASTKADQGDVDGAREALTETATNLKTLVTENEKSFSTEAREAAAAVEEDIRTSNEQAQAERQAAEDQAENSDKDPNDPVDDKDVTNADASDMDFPVEGR